MSNLAFQIHQLFDQLRRFRFPFSEYEVFIPKNGVYVLFEAGEKYCGLDRIVRVGTHTGNNQLRSRLKQHFLIENKNRSIFRKNIGRCILSMAESSYLPIWELDTTSRAKRLESAELINADFEREIERKISQHIHSKLSFCVFPVEQKNQRLFWEKKIVSTLSKTSDFNPSADWLGSLSPKDKIRVSGLWQVNELYKDELTDEEFDGLRRLVNID